MTRPSPPISPAVIPLREATFRLTLTGGTATLSAASDGVQALLGHPAADFLSGKMRLHDLIHADDQDIAAILFSPAVQNPEGDCNLRLRSASGRILCVKGHYHREATAAGVVLDLRLQDAKSLPRTMAEAATMPHLATMLEATDDYIYFKDRNHCITGASQTLVALCSPATHWTDLLGQTDYDVFPESLADHYYRLEKQVFAGLPLAHEVQETLGTDGRKGWVDNRKYPLRDASGAIIGLYGIARDITAQLLHEQAQRKSALQLSLVIRGGEIGYWDWNFVTGGLEVNDGWLSILGLDAQGPPPTIAQWTSLVHPEDRPKLVRLLDEVILKPSGTNGEVEIRARHTAGHYVWILDKFSVVERTANGSPLRVIGTHVDITARVEMEDRLRQDAVQADRMRRALLSTLEDQKRAQTAVREREVRYGAMVDSIADAIISADSAGQIIGWNPGAEKTFGYPVSAILGQPLLLLLPARYLDRHSAGMARVMAGGPHHIIGTIVEVEGRRKDGSEFPMTLSLSEWQLGDRKFVTAIIRDITAQKAEEANFAAKMTELRRWQKATLGRESRVLELKREINALRASHGEPPRYASVVQGTGPSPVSLEPPRSPSVLEEGKK